MNLHLCMTPISLSSFHEPLTISTTDLDHWISCIEHKCIRRTRKGHKHFQLDFNYIFPDKSIKNIGHIVLHENGKDFDFVEHKLCPKGFYHWYMKTLEARPKVHLKVRRIHRD